MTQEKYLDILEDMVKVCLDRGEQFILEEDGDSGHGGADNSNMVRRWKEKHGLQYYINAPKSPDLAPIENCWQPVKQYLPKADYWNVESTLVVVRKGWRDYVKQQSIDKWVMEMQNRLHDVLDRKGQITGH